MIYSSKDIKLSISACNYCYIYNISLLKKNVFLRFRSLTLYQHWSPPKVQDRRGATPLLIACKAGNTDGALVLIDKGADILISDINGDTPLHLAVRHSRTMIVTALIEMAESKGDINEVNMVVCEFKNHLY